MAFTKYARSMSTLAKAPAVTIQRRGNIGMNAAAHRVLGSPDAVELWFDDETRRIGITSCDLTAEHAYKMRPLGKSGSSWIITATTFTDYNRINTEVARRYQANMEDGMLVIDVSVPGTAIVSNAHRGRAATSPGNASGVYKGQGTLQ